MGDYKYIFENELLVNFHCVCTNVLCENSPMIKFIIRYDLIHGWIKFLFDEFWFYSFSPSI